MKHNTHQFQILAVLFIWLMLLGVEDLLAKEATEPDNWGVALGIRSAKIPFETEIERVNDVIPLIFYEQGRFFFRGISTGFKFVNQAKWDISVLGRYRYLDIPAEYQNQIRGNAFDLGFQYRYKWTENVNSDIEVMNDQHGRFHANIAADYTWESGNWELQPFTRLRWKDSEFNDAYYGLNLTEIGSALDLTIGGSVRYHIYENFYAIGRASATFLDRETYTSEFVNTPNQNEIYLGIAFFKDKTQKTRRRLKSRPYIRVAHGWATPSDVGELLVFKIKNDPYNNQLSSVFYGIPVADKLFSIPFSIYITPGYVYHHSSEVQSNFPEYVFAIKAYYTVKWPTKWRVGAAEGLSYTSRITYIEQQEMDKEGFETSNLLNFLDFSVDIELGELFNAKPLKNTWLGYSLHHRSGIFQTSSAFGRISGGSNYNTVYVQYHW